MPFIPDQPKNSIGFRPDKKTIGGFLSNVGKSGIDAAGSIGSSILNIANPDLEKNTVANLGRLGADTVKLIGGDTSESNRARQVGRFYKQRYGGLENIGNTIYNDPVGVALDVSTVLGGTGAVARGLGLSRAGKALTTASRLSDPLQLATMGAGKVAGGALGKAGKVLEQYGEAKPFSGLHDPKIQTKIKGVSGKSPYELTQQYNTWDRNPASAQRAIKSIEDIVERKTAGKNVNTSKILKRFDDEIANLGDDISDNARIQRDYLEATKQKFLESIKGKNSGGVLDDFDQSVDVVMGNKGSIEDITKAREYIMKEAKRQLTLEELSSAKSIKEIINKLQKRIKYKDIDYSGGEYSQVNIPSERARELKQQIGSDRPKNSWNMDSAESAKSEGVGKAYNVFKNELNSLDPSLKQLGRDESALIELQKLFEREQGRAGARNMIGIGGLITGVGGYATGGIVPAVGAIVGKKLIESPMGIRATSETLRGTGKVLQNAKIPNLPYDKGYSGVKLNRFVNPGLETNRESEIQPQIPEYQEQPRSYNPPKVNNLVSPLPDYTTAKQPKVNFPESNIFKKVGKLKKSNSY